MTNNFKYNNFKPYNSIFKTIFIFIIKKKIFN